MENFGVYLYKFELNEVSKYKGRIETIVNKDMIDHPIVVGFRQRCCETFDFDPKKSFESKRNIQIKTIKSNKISIMKNMQLYIFGFISLSILLAGCTEKNTSRTVLFNGKDLEGWHVYNQGKNFNGWTVRDGTILFDPKAKKDMVRTDLTTDSEYTSFEISLDWKIGEYGNSGLFWAVVEDPQYKFSYDTGIEIQILDDNWAEYIKQNGDKTRAGALYGLMAPSSVVSKRGDEWNHYLLHIDYNENQGWLKFNEQEVLRFPLYGPGWDAMVTNTRFADQPLFGKARKGHIVLQEYGGGVSFRNIEIRELTGLK